jgi:hypothetical protein
MRSGVVGNGARLLLASALFLSGINVRAELLAHDYSVELIANVSENPAEIELQWIPGSNAQNYQISRKILGNQNWTLLATIGGGETSWKDQSVTPGTAYEYQVVKNTGLDYTGWGYVCAAIRRTAVEDRGKMILLVERELGAALGSELARLQQDLVGDGWTVVRRDIDKTTPLPDVKSVIREIYNADPAGTKGLFLFGHLPIPYSGNICPDMHSDDQGAWPADVYYAEFDGEWTDSTVTITSSSNPNIPGDGKFDQSDPPGAVRLQMGRVDLSMLTCFANKTPARSELDLARQYLIKDHNFRHGLFDVQRRAMIYDRLFRGGEPEPQTCAAWRSFPGFFGRDQVRQIGQNQYFPILNSESYMWSYVVSGGSVYGSDYIGTSDDWALNEPKVVFTSFLGSWFGQWEKESDFLRAPLGTSGYTLASIFSGQPQWILHPMAMGETIGYSAMLTQNNNTNNGIYPPQGNAGAGQVHIDLMGDPSLRMHIVKPPGAVSATANDSGVTLNWGASPDNSLLGYYVYKSNSAEGPFRRISGADPVPATSFTDSDGNANSCYIVRALKLEQTPTGSYYNLSQGVFYPDAAAANGLPNPPQSLSIAGISRGSVDIMWVANFVNVRAFEIQRRLLPNGTFSKIGEVPNGAATFSDTNLTAGVYAYRVKALGFAGDSGFSGEASINFNPSWGVIAGTDRETKGDWIGKYGAEGYILPAIATNLPAYVTFTGERWLFVYGLDFSDDEPETLLYPDAQHRFLMSWFNKNRVPMKLSLRFNDSRIHRVSFYMLDYHRGDRNGTVSVVDPLTGAALDSIHFEDCSSGEYVTVDVRNYADIFISPEFPDQFEVPLNGIFFDAAPEINSSNQFSLVGMDTITQGDWKSKYGNQGQTVPEFSSNLPSGVTVNQSNQPWIWESRTFDKRALNRYADDATRIASTWYSSAECVLDLNIDTAQPKQIALYMLDWDNAGRVQDVVISDANNTALLTRRISNFDSGQYLVFNAKGSIRVSAKLVSGPNAVINGVFFGVAPLVFDFFPVNLNPPSYSAADHSYSIRFTGRPGQVFDVEASTDFRSWTKIGQQTLSGNSFDMPMPYDTTSGVRFFRAVLAQ